jgi:hypothetical protein
MPYASNSILHESHAKTYDICRISPSVDVPSVQPKTIVLYPSSVKEVLFVWKERVVKGEIEPQTQSRPPCQEQMEDLEKVFVFHIGVILLANRCWLSEAKTIQS